MIQTSIGVIDSHTAGHPTRVVVSGVPSLKGETVRAQRDDFRSRFDYLRPALQHEPRGHAATVSCILVPSRVADFGAIFISTYVYLDMCGHGTIGLARTLASTGQISPGTGDSFTLEVPAGIVTVHLEWGREGDLGNVRIRNVPSYPGPDGLGVTVDGVGRIAFSLAYGGMWYAMVDRRTVDIPLLPENISRLLSTGKAIKDAIAAIATDIECLEGAATPSVLFFDEQSASEATHLLVLDSNKFDRSPCGTATSARTALLASQGRLATGEAYTARNILGNAFTARPVGRDEDNHWIVDIEGRAYLTGFATLVFEGDDPLAEGFLCR